jgi:hypothetical protein
MEQDTNRKKRCYVAIRKINNLNKEFVIIKMKLNSFIKNEEFKNLLFVNITNINNIKYEAFNFINLHFLRCLEYNLDLPDFNQDLFYNCISIISKTYKQKEQVSKNIELQNTYSEHYKSLCPPNHIKPFRDYSGALINNVTKEMKTVCDNHIILNFNKRLLRYIQLKYNIHKKQALWLINNIYDEKLYYTLSKVEDEIKNFIVFKPTEEIIKANIHHFITLLYKIQKYFDTLNPNTKHLRKFTILPTKSSFIHSYVTCCSSCVKDILKSSDNQKLKKIAKDDNDVMWSKLFNIKCVETTNKKFNKIVSTDGYGVSITLYKSLKVEDKEINVNGKIICDCGHTVSKGGYKKHLLSQKHLKYKNTTSVEVNINNEKYRYVGLDPGVSYIYTAVDDKNKFIRCSNTCYRKESKITKSIKWNKNQLKKNPSIQRTINELKTYKTSSLEEYKNAVKHNFMYYNELTTFYNIKPYKKWKFTTYCLMKKAINKMCKTICDDKKTIVGFGDWSQQQGIIKKHPSAPNKKLREALKRYRDCISLISINEYRTSKECSLCHNEVKKLNLITKIKNKNEERVYYKLKECHQVVRCSNNECSKCWQRDYNASKNIIQKLFEKLCINISREETVLIDIQNLTLTG